MKIIITSDSHGRNSILDLIPYYHEDAQYFIFCGDLHGDPSYYEKWTMVEGNCDYFEDVPQALKIDLENGHKILVLHSHQAPGWPKEARKLQLKIWAKEEGCDIVCYGHTHVSDIDTIDDVLLINPGSLSRPRDGKECSYCVLTIDEDNQLHPELIFESDWTF
ncbi:MAG: metallophosphoesterase [Firmicutes bacterium]|nr:metallophosphoesterase [Bacillota bacterium]